jgi:hypothetical protein
MIYILKKLEQHIKPLTLLLMQFLVLFGVIGQIVLPMLEMQLILAGEL